MRDFLVKVVTLHQDTLWKVIGRISSRKKFWMDVAVSRRVPLPPPINRWYGLKYVWMSLRYYVVLTTVRIQYLPMYFDMNTPWYLVATFWSVVLVSWWSGEVYIVNWSGYHEQTFSTANWKYASSMWRLSRFCRSTSALILQVQIKIITYYKCRSN